jgi:glycosyltransferase involved in cell wall biosynthesis
MRRNVTARRVEATVHDLGLVRGLVGGTVSVARARRDLVRLLRAADHVVTVSAVTRADLLAEFPGLRRPVTVVYPGLIPVAATAPPAPPRRYGLFVGATNRRKNLVGLISAVAELRGRGDWPEDLVLALAGPPGDQEEDVARAIARHGVARIVRRLGYVETDAELEGWIRGAEWLVLPGWYEGFGLPVLRAMTAGVPVLASDTGAIPEVTAGAAALFPPGDAAALARLLGEVVDRPRRRAELAARGLERSRAFSLDAFGEALMVVYREAVSSAAPGSLAVGGRL